MSSFTRIACTALGALALQSLSPLAWAQEVPSRLPPPPPPPPSAQAPNGEYATPLAQQTQPTYVPQSVAFSGPRTIRDWNEGDPIPPGYHPVQRVRTGLIVGGAVMLGTLYFISALVAAGVSDGSHGSQQDNALYIPGFGPFIQMASTSSSVANVFLFMDGAIQSGGFAMLAYGIASPKTVLVRNDLGSAPLVLPMRLGQDGYGLGLVTRF